MATGTSAAAKINFRASATMKRTIEQLSDELGLDISTTPNMFLKQSIREQALPIRPTISHMPNATTMQTIEHAEAICKGEIPEDGTVFDDVGDAVKFLDTLVWMSSLTRSSKLTSKE